MPRSFVILQDLMASMMIPAEFGESLPGLMQLPLQSRHTRPARSTNW
jgi:hypothetical protein